MNGLAGYLVSIDEALRSEPNDFDDKLKAVMFLDETDWRNLYSKNEGDPLVKSRLEAMTEAFRKRRKEIEKRLEGCCSSATRGVLKRLARSILAGSRLRDAFVHRALNPSPTVDAASESHAALSRGDDRPADATSDLVRRDLPCRASEALNEQEYAFASIALLLWLRPFNRQVGKDETLRSRVITKLLEPPRSGGILVAWVANEPVLRDEGTSKVIVGTGTARDMTPPMPIGRCARVNSLLFVRDDEHLLRKLHKAMGNKEIDLARRGGGALKLFLQLSVPGKQRKTAMQVAVQALESLGWEFQGDDKSEVVLTCERTEKGHADRDQITLAVENALKAQGFPVKSLAVILAQQSEKLGVSFETIRQRDVARDALLAEVEQRQVARDAVAMVLSGLGWRAETSGAFTLTFKGTWSATSDPDRVQQLVEDSLRREELPSDEVIVEIRDERVTHRPLAEDECLPDVTAARSRAEEDDARADREQSVDTVISDDDPGANGGNLDEERRFRELARRIFGVEESLEQLRSVARSEDDHAAAQYGASLVGLPGLGTNGPANACRFIVAWLLMEKTEGDDLIRRKVSGTLVAKRQWKRRIRPVLLEKLVGPDWKPSAADKEIDCRQSIRRAQASEILFGRTPALLDRVRRSVDCRSFNAVLRELMGTDYVGEERVLGEVRRWMMSNCNENMRGFSMPALKRHLEGLRERSGTPEINAILQRICR